MLLVMYFMIHAGSFSVYKLSIIQLFIHDLYATSFKNVLCTEVYKQASEKDDRTEHTLSCGLGLIKFHLEISASLRSY